MLRAFREDTVGWHSILQVRAAPIFKPMHPDLQRFFNHVWPIFWPWLVWNLLRVARWHMRTGRDALMPVDSFGNIELTYVSDAPPPDTLYTYEAPRLAAWEHPALRSDGPTCVCACSGIVRHDPDKSGLVIHSHGLVRHDHWLRVRGPPWPSPLPNSVSHTGWQPPCRANVLGGAYASTE